MASLRRQRGAALLLMLALLGLGAASLFLHDAARHDSRAGPDARTAAALGQAREALLGFALAHGRLPRPARDDGGAEFDGRCDSERACTGVLPWATLGLAPGDGRGRPLRYSVTPVMTSAPLRTTVAFGTKRVLTRAGTEAADPVYLAGAPECSLATRCPAAVVLAPGPEDAVNGAPVHADARANRHADLAFMRRAAGAGFHDQLTWVPVELLLNRMSMAGVLPRAE